MVEQQPSKHPTCFRLALGLAHEFACVMVGDARGDIAQIKATLIEFRERIDRIEANEDGRKHA